MPKRRPPEKAYKDQAFLQSPQARSLRILSEYLAPLDRLEKLKVNSTVLFLGSARVKPRRTGGVLSPYYWEAEELAFQLASWAKTLKPRGKDFVICTGAGPGIMEAANRGAARAGAKSIGMNISIPTEQFPNPYISPELSFVFHYFFMRKFWLISKARAVVAFPGGFGTLDEVFEILTLLQAGKIGRRETVLLLYGERYWRSIIDFDELLRARAISPSDLNLFSFSSSPDRAFRYLRAKLRASP